MPVLIFRSASAFSLCFVPGLAAVVPVRIFSPLGLIGFRINFLLLFLVLFVVMVSHYPLTTQRRREGYRLRRIPSSSALKSDRKLHPLYPPPQRRGKCIFVGRFTRG